MTVLAIYHSILMLALVEHSTLTSSQSKLFLCVLMTPTVKLVIRKSWMSGVDRIGPQFWSRISVRCVNKSFKKVKAGEPGEFGISGFFQDNKSDLNYSVRSSGPGFYILNIDILKE